MSAPEPGIVIRGPVVEYQGVRMRLEPVGLDWDGEVKPLASLGDNRLIAETREIVARAYRINDNPGG